MAYATHEYTLNRPLTIAGVAYPVGTRLDETQIRRTVARRLVGRQLLTQHIDFGASHFDMPQHRHWEAGGWTMSQSTQVTAPPANTSPPVITGSTAPGSTYTVTPGHWTGIPIPTLDHQWRVNGADVAGETGLTFTPVPALANGDVVTCRETAANGVGAPVTADSNAITVVAAPPVNTTAPVIAGSTAPGSTYTVTPGTWTGNPVPTVTRQWTVNGADVAGETGLSFTPTPNLVPGDIVACREDATNAAGSALRWSNTITVAGTAPVNTVLHAISGPTTPGTGPWFLDHVGTWTGNPAPTLTRQWTVNGADIPGATGAAYAPTTPLVSGDELDMRETADNGVGPPVSVMTGAPIVIV